jgi:putative ABC transport system permease protein
VVVWETDAHNASFSEGGSFPDYLDLTEQAQSFTTMGGSWGADVTVTDPALPPERIQTLIATHSYFRNLGVPPLLGRDFNESDDRAGSEQITILSHDFWQRRFGSSRDVLGRKLTVDGHQYTVVGVMPQQFRFPRDTDMFVPLHAFPDNYRDARGRHNLFMTARLKPGVTIDQAQAEMDTIAKRLEKQYPDSNAGRGFRLEPLHEAMIGNVRRPLLVLFGAVVLVLLIACANVAGLQIARATSRAREVAIRTSLGASRFHITRQLMTESLALGLAGGLVGLALAYWCIDALVAFSPENLPRIDSVRMSTPVLLFTLATSIAAGIVAGIVPAIQGSRRALADSLKAGSGAIAGRIRANARLTLVISEVAVAAVLVIGAGLLMRSFWRLINVDPGFRAANVLVVDLTLPSQKYPEPPREVYPRWPEAIQFFNQSLERVREIPGVTSAAIALNHPMRAGWTSQLRIPGRPEVLGQIDEVRIRPVTPMYFGTVGVPILRGRDIANTDTNDAPRVVLVNESFAKTFFPGADPIGKTISFWNMPREIIGVVRDVRFRGVNRPSEPALYPSLLQMPMSSVSLIVQTGSNPMKAFPTVRDAIWSVDRDLALGNVKSLEQLLHESVGSARFQMLLLSIFGAVALLLAAIGIYGVISYQVNQRTREMGVRLALGAGHGQLVRLVVGEGAALAAAGIGIGVAGAAVVTRLISAMLFGVSERDLVTFAAVALLLGLVAIIASYLPARRLSRINPVIALRYE